MKEKCCGNCKRFENEGFGWCTAALAEVGCDHSCPNHKFNNDGWIEITSDNVDEVDCIPRDKVVIGWVCNEEFRSCTLSSFWITLKAIVHEGGFYYYVLPELKIE